MNLTEFQEKYSQFSEYPNKNSDNTFERGSSEETICKQMIADADLLSDELDADTCYGMILYNQIGTYGTNNHKPSGYSKCYKSSVLWTIYTGCCQYLETRHLEIGLDKLSTNLKKGKKIEYKKFIWENWETHEVTRFKVEKGVFLFHTGYGKLTFDHKEKFYTYLALLCEAAKNYYGVWKQINCEDFEPLRDGFCGLPFETAIQLTNNG